MEVEEHNEEIVKKEEEKKQKRDMDSDSEEDEDIDVGKRIYDETIQKDGKSKSQKAFRALKKNKQGAGLANKIPTSWRGDLLMKYSFTFNEMQTEIIATTTCV